MLSNPAAAGSYFEHQSYIAERPDLYDAYSAWELEQRESLLDSSPLRTAPVSSFLRVGYGAGAIAYQVLTDLVESGGDIEDRASIIAAFGGMENPRLTFATPTIIAGDRSLVALIAHELAHSWSGNLVTNATWNDFWLNEGFTVYFERRIMESLYGRDYSEMLALLGYQDLTEEGKAL